MGTVELAIAFWLFVLGCAVGSFLNVCIWRLPRGMAINNPSRSLCPGCRHPIAWYDNIPLISFLALRARCRHCGELISWRYPLVEGLTGALFALIYVRQGVIVGTGRGQLVVMMLLSAMLIVASAVDMEFRIIPDEISLFGLLAGLFAGLLLPQLHVGPAAHHTFRALTGFRHLDGLIGSATGALVGGGTVFVCALVGELMFRKEALGFGDVKLMAMVGAFLGWKAALVVFFLSPFFGLVYGLPLLVLKGQHTMPFGPFLSCAAMVTVLFRTELCRYLVPLEQLIKLVLGN